MQANVSYYFPFVMVTRLFSLKCIVLLALESGDLGVNLTLLFIRCVTLNISYSLWEPHPSSAKWLIKVVLISKACWPLNELHTQHSA